jgi:ATP-dependent protease ClpP protease subunit
MAQLAIVFNGPISPPASTRLRNAICGAANGGIAGLNNQPPEKIWILMSSGGGGIEDGFSLYNLLRIIKPQVVTVNMGQIASIANVVFLAGEHRIACPQAYFHFHDFDWPFTAAHTMSRENLKDTSQLLEIARTNKKSLFKARTTLTDADFEALEFLEEPIIRDANFAQQKGIIQEICIPDLPDGTPILNVDY